MARKSAAGADSAWGERYPTERSHRKTGLPNFLEVMRPWRRRLYRELVEASAGSGPSIDGRQYLRSGRVVGTISRRILRDRFGQTLAFSGGYGPSYNADNYID